MSLYYKEHNWKYDVEGLFGEQATLTFCVADINRLAFHLFNSLKLL